MDCLRITSSANAKKTVTMCVRGGKFDRPRAGQITIPHSRGGNEEGPAHLPEQEGHSIVPKISQARRPPPAPSSASPDVESLLQSG